MENWTPAEVWAAVLAFASAFVLLSNAAEKAVKAWKAWKAPSEQLNDRMDEFDEWRKDVDRKLLRDHDRLQDIDNGNRVTQQALLALLDHGIDGNNIEQMQHAKERLQNHLINR